MGGPTKIDSVQDAWDNCEFGVDPNVSPISIRQNLFEGSIAALLPLPMAIKM